MIRHKGSSQMQDILNMRMVLEAIDKYVSRKLIEEQISKSEAQEKKRKKLPSFVVIYLLLCQSLFRGSNRHEVLRKMVEGYQIRGWQVRTDKLAGAGGISKSMKRVGCEVMKKLFEEVISQNKPNQESCYKKLRLRAYDGSCFNLEDSPENQEMFGRPRSKGENESAWPQIKILLEVDVGTRQPLGVEIGSYRQSEKEMLMDSLAKRKDLGGSLTLLDRGLGWCKYMKEIEQRNGKYLAHTISRQKIEVLEPLPDGSYLGQLKARDSREKILVRVIEYRICNEQRGDPKEVHRLVSNLLDWREYPSSELIDLYHQRWEIEISFDELKTHLFGRNKMESFFRSRRGEGVRQELYGVLVLYSVIRSLMQEAAQKYELQARQLSFTDCVHILRRNVIRMQAARTETLPRLYEQMLDEMASSLLPPRRNRMNPRVVKKPYSKYKPKRPYHLSIKKMDTSFLQDTLVLTHA